MTQGPSHVDNVAPGVEPYRPGSHGPEQLGVDDPLTFAYTPAGHWVHEDEPVREYMPLGQEVHTPPEADDVPAAQAVQGVLLPVLLNPAGQFVQAGAPATVAIDPAGHTKQADPDTLVDPTRQFEHVATPPMDV